MSLKWLRGFVYTLFGTLVLSTLWVTSLTLLSTRQNATQILTDAGTQILNPFLVGRDVGLGLSQITFAELETSARAHPSQPLTFSVLKVQVLGREIIGHTYTDVVHLVYARVAEVYYDKGGAAVFDIPPQLQQVLPNFALFNPNDLPLVPGGPKPGQLPTFLQPFFTFIGLTPETFTAAGHQKIANLLPWFWIALILLGVLAVLLNRTDQKLAGLAQGVVHGSWPVVAVLLILSVLSFIFTARFAPYTGILGLVSGAFLPVYGTAFAIGIAGVAITKILERRSQGQSATGGDGGAEQAALAATMAKTMGQDASSTSQGSGSTLQ